MLSSLNLGVKTETYFVSSSNMFLDKKTLLKIWLNPGLNHLLRNRARTRMTARDLIVFV